MLQILEPVLSAKSYIHGVKEPKKERDVCDNSKVQGAEPPKPLKTQGQKRTWSYRF